MNPIELQNLNCWIYRSSRKDEMYLYLAAEDGFDAVPQSLLKLFGEPVPVMELALNAGRRLAREDVVQVMQNLRERGFHLQMPPSIVPERADA
jgi:uncharacterized protein YcgL (UPF0745 family)